MEINLHKFLYLAKKEWAKSWMDGGRVPIFAASKYLSQDRKGTNTPDENTINDFVHPPKEYEKYGIIIQEGTQNLTMKNNYYNGIRMPEENSASFYREDGLILCFSNSYKLSIMNKLVKTCCVKIHDVERLRLYLNKKIGIEGIGSTCRYTNSHQRDHFLKSVKDSWQDEYRIFWKSPNREIIVDIEPGTAELVD